MTVLSEWVQGPPVLDDCGAPADGHIAHSHVCLHSPLESLVILILAVLYLGEGGGVGGEDTKRNYEYERKTTGTRKRDLWVSRCRVCVDSRVCAPAWRCEREHRSQSMFCRLSQKILGAHATWCDRVASNMFLLTCVEQNTTKVANFKCSISYVFIKARAFFCSSKNQR
jgi:hypothetical protein